MTPGTEKKLKRRLDHLADVLSDCTGKNEDDPELVALFYSVRDIQPGLCEAMAEHYKDDGWLNEYRATIRSDEEQKAKGEFIWVDDEP
jgi:hypothetical protein